MQDLLLFFQLGWSHIISIEALDHLLFLTALMAVYQLQDWKKVLVLITAFTVGHSATLISSIYNWVHFSSHWVEFLIPLTILLTALSNFFKDKSIYTKQSSLRYFLALVFGLIHGMGFASTLRFMLSEDQSIGIPLLSFNLGIEAGQMIVVIILLTVTSVILKKIKIPQHFWGRLISFITGTAALVICLQRWPF